LKHYISSSKSCYGYSIPIKNLYKLNRFTTGSKIKKLSYLVPQKTKVTINISKKDKVTINISKKDNTGDKLYKILDKFQAQK